MMDPSDVCEFTGEVKQSTWTRARDNRLSLARLDYLALNTI